MLAFVSYLWSNFSDWKENQLDQASVRYYVEGRAIFKGLPIAVISSIATAIFFQCARPFTATIFGTVNYIILTTLIETSRNYTEDKIDSYKAGTAIVGIASILSALFLQTIFKMSMSYQATVLLSAAAFTGQLLRLTLMTER